MSDSIHDDSKQGRDGGSAFPYQRDITLYDPANPTAPAQTIHGYWQGGMSLRDYFIAHAPEIPRSVLDQYNDAGFTTAWAYAKWRVHYADAQLKERAK